MVSVFGNIIGVFVPMSCLSADRCTYGEPMVNLWCTYGVPMVSLWCTYGEPMVSLNAV